MTTPHQSQPHADGIPDDIHKAARAAWLKADEKILRTDSYVVIAKAIMSERQRIYAHLEKLDGDSLDAMIEVIGEGPEFKRYNQGKSSMRDWFLRRINTILPKPPSATQSQKTGR